MVNEDDRTGIQKVEPVIRVAPLGELKAYIISENELDELARGSPASLLLNLALAFIPTRVTFLIALLTITIQSTRIFIVFVICCVVFVLAGVILLLLWWRYASSSRSMINRIRKRMPPARSAQEG
ncbi:MAG: hypothetical protein IH895_10190 [Planctomycetes bacterium]|nr:hypothetical protein [Planctomycetota bacterium]